MENKAERLLDLLRRYESDEASVAEIQELLGLLAGAHDDRAIQNVFIDLLESERPVMSDQEKLKELAKTITNRGLVSDGVSEGKLVAMRRPTILKRIRWVAAAILIGVISFTGWLVFRDHKELKESAVAKVDVKAPVINRLAITLGNGKTVYLDSAANGQLSAENGVQLIKLADGKFAYNGTAETKEMVYNTATNPAGSQVADLQLSDGSHVWLNAGSSITYPVSMNERRVSIKGEAYFEVAKNPARPFTVSKGVTNVTVLGTHFNVKAYDNEPSLKVTLLEGSVRVQNNHATQLLQPNQQAIVTDQIQLVKDADTEEALAWKNGRTMINDADVASVLREIERWYNIETEVKGTISNRSFYVNVKRSGSLMEMLKVLTDNHINYEYDAEKRKLIVIP